MIANVRISDIVFMQGAKFVSVLLNAILIVHLDNKASLSLSLVILTVLSSSFTMLSLLSFLCSSSYDFAIFPFLKIALFKLSIIIASVLSFHSSIIISSLVFLLITPSSLTSSSFSELSSSSKLPSSSLLSSSELPLLVLSNFLSISST